MSKLFHCIDCNLIYAATPLDNTPGYLYLELEEGYSVKESHFENSHEDHQTEELTILDLALYSEGAYFDPCRVTYLTATNGKKTLLIKKWRESITEPQRYDVVQGRLLVNRSLEIQKADLQKQLFYEIRDPERVTELIKIIEEEALYLNPALEPYETFESNAAQISYLPLKDEQITRILNRCRASSFTQEEYERVERFIRSNCEYTGVMSLVVRKTARLIPKSSRSRVVKHHYTHTHQISLPLHFKG